MQLELELGTWKPTLGDWTFAVQFGLLVGICHHFLIQFPRQAHIFTTLYAYLVGNLSFHLLCFLPQTHHPSPATLAFGTLIFNISYITSAALLKVVYNVYFRHRGIPTTFWMAATDLHFWNVYRHYHSYKHIHKVHKQLGDVVRIQPNHISFNTLEAVHALHNIRTKVVKSEVYKNVMPIGPGAPQSLFSETDKRRHGFLRRTSNPLFSQTFLRTLEVQMHGYLEMFIQGIKREAHENKGLVNITSWIEYLTFDVSGALSLGADFGALESHEHELLETLSMRWRFVAEMFGIPWIMPLLDVLPQTAANKKLRTSFKQWAANAIQQTLKKETDDKQERSYLTALTTASDPETGEKLSAEDTSINATAFIFAAADTTAISLVFIIYHLVTNPQTWTSLAKEIRTNFEREEDLTYQALASLPYLDAVIHEGTRLSPAVPSNLMRRVPPEGMSISNHFIPGNTDVSTDTWVILHDERHFSNPMSFIPERFLEPNTSGETCDRKAWIPFSTGLRGCIGRPLAMMEMKCAIARFVWTFDAEMGSGEGPRYEECFVAQRSAFNIRVQPVQR